MQEYPAESVMGAMDRSQGWYAHAPGYSSLQSDLG